MENNSDKDTPLFSIRALCKKFPGESYISALQDINLDIYNGECLLIAGANGAGKTVLMKILAGLLEPTEGEITFMGKPLSECKGQLRQSVGLMFQEPDLQILGETVEEDIRFGPENLKLPEKEIEERLEETLSALELSQKRRFAARHLSGGEKRRLVVAGVLAMGCETIIMDEPFANLDWPGVVQVLKIIAGLKNKNKTVIVLTHELEKVLALADRLVIMTEGKIKYSGSPEEALSQLEPSWGVRDPRKKYSSAADCTWLE